MTRYREPGSNVVHAARRRGYNNDVSLVLLACMDDRYYRYNAGMIRVSDSDTLTCLECITEESDSGRKQVLAR